MPHRTFRSAVLAPVLAGCVAFGFAFPGLGAQSSSGDCPLEPLTLPLFDATPAAIVAATPAVAISVAAVDIDEAEIGAAIEDIVACVNTGDPARQYAIFTERYLAEQFADPSVAYQPRFEFDLAMGPGEGEALFELISVSGIAPIEPGRVSVTVELAAGDTRYRDTLVLASVDGVWLIDAIGELDPAP